MAIVGAACQLEFPLWLCLHNSGQSLCGLPLVFVLVFFWGFPPNPPHFVPSNPYQHASAIPFGPVLPSSWFPPCFVLQTVIHNKGHESVQRQVQLVLCKLKFHPWVRWVVRWYNTWQAEMGPWDLPSALKTQPRVWCQQAWEASALDKVDKAAVTFKDGFKGSRECTLRI